MILTKDIIFMKEETILKAKTDSHSICNTKDNGSESQDNGKLIYRVPGDACGLIIIEKG